MQARSSKWLRSALIGAGLGVLAGALSLVVSRADVAQRLESSTYDLRVARTSQPIAPESPIVIVEINESSVRALGPVVGRWPWPRLVHASAIDYLARAGAKVIAYDVLFLEPEGRADAVINDRRISGDESDRALGDAARRAGNLILLAETTFEELSGAKSQNVMPLPLPGATYAPGGGFLRRPGVHLPFPALAEAVAGVGHNYLAKDQNSDAIRRTLPFVESGGSVVPSLGMAAALAFLRAEPGSVRLEGDVLGVGDARLPLLADSVRSADGSLLSSRQALIRWVQPQTPPGGERSIFPTYSFFDVVLSEDRMHAGLEPAIPQSAFAGKLVFVGTTAAGMHDRYATPFAGGAAGVEIHAIAADNLISQRFMRRASVVVDTCLTLVAGAAAGVAATTLPLSVALLTVLSAAGVLAWWLTHQVGQGLWVALVTPLGAAGLALFSGVAWRYFVEDREKRHVRRLFGRYVSNDVIEQLMADPARLALGGERRDMTVLFSDIRGFTSASERASPEEVVAQLNEYFGAMVEVLFRYGGTLDKFVGDMVMGLFGAPLPDPAHADHAVAAALDMIRTLDGLNERWKAAGKSTLNIGVGINSGEMIAGNIGSEAIMSYTVIGDAVNLGSRLESLNKDYGTRILISEATRSRLTIAAGTRLIGEVTVKGRTQPVQVYEVFEQNLESRSTS